MSPLSSLLPSISALGLAALFALYLALARHPSSDNKAQQKLAAQALGVAVILQGIHFTEELVTGFHERFPAIFGLEAIPVSIFIAFNVLWLMAWSASIRGIEKTVTIAYFAAWFLAIAGILNGIAHPMLALAEGSYFPGLFSSPFIAIACVALWRRLIIATRPVLA